MIYAIFLHDKTFLQKNGTSVEENPFKKALITPKGSFSSFNNSVK